MRIFKNNVFKCIFSLAFIGALLIGMDQGLRVILEPVSFATYFNPNIREIEESGVKVDMVFLGASRTQRTFVPQVFEDELGYDCVVNAGSVLQPVSGTYYELKDMIERLHPKCVCIGVTWDQLINEPRLQGKLIVCDRLSFCNKVLMEVRSLTFEEKKYVSYAYRFKDNLDIEKIESNISLKKKLRGLDYHLVLEDEDYYADNGFVYGYGGFDSGTIGITGDRVFSEDLIRKDSLNYLNKCIDLCKKEGVNVILVSGLTSVMTMYNVPAYQDAVDYYTDYAHSKGIDYYNLNYLKNREEYIPDELMYDYNHINGKGAYMVSRDFARILKRAMSGEDVSSCFYANMDDFKKDVKRIVAVGADCWVDEDNEDLLHLNIRSLQNDDIEPLYRVSVKYSGPEDFRLVRDWDKDTIIDIRTSELSEITVRLEARPATGAYGGASHDYSYRELVGE